MKKLFISCILIFLTLNVNATISQSGITNLKQLDKNGIIDLVSGNQLTGFISDGPFEGPIKQTYFKDGRYETVYGENTYEGQWNAQGESYATPKGKKMCTKNNNATDWTCFYWYTGKKDGGTYAYIISQGLIFHQYHKIKSVVQIKAEAKKAAERKGVASGKYDSLKIVTHEYEDGSKSYFVNGLPISTKTYNSYIRGEIGAKKLIDLAHNDKESKENGLDRLWGENENILQVRSWKNDELNGEYTQWYDNGQIKEEVNFIDGNKDGKFTSWHENGQKHREANYKDGKLDGKQTQWYENGQKEAEAIYEDGECVSGDCVYQMIVIKFD